MQFGTWYSATAMKECRQWQEFRSDAQPDSSMRVFVPNSYTLPGWYPVQ
jgi:hypothetical protein